tara:strand:+ start:495 stop:1712 length:1218 start_codon:yes stop_codon:yes gene_type:complete
MSDSSLRVHFEGSTIETIDRSVYNFVSSLQLQVNTNKGFKPVPVIWGSAERSFQSKDKKEIRDNQGLLVLPIISIRRSSFDKSRVSSGIFQGNVPEVNDGKGGALNVSRVLYQKKTMRFANADAQKLYGQKNYPSPNPKIVYKTISVPMPVNVEVMYEITLRTEYQQQMNDLITPFATKPGTVNFIRLTEGPHKYEGFIQENYASSDNLSDFSSDERKFETKINIKVIGYIVGEGKNRDRPAFALRENAVEIKIPRERISLAEIPEHEFGAYYGLEGIPAELKEAFLNDDYHFSNVPAASFFNTSGQGGGSVSANVVTSENFSQVLSQNMIVRETLKESTDLTPSSFTDFSTLFPIRENTESVLVNGVLQADGSLKDYTIIGGNTIRFNDNVDQTDFIVVTYIKE